MYRLLATDIDDTVLAPDGSLPEANRAALLALHGRGVPVVFCSGRADVSIRRLAERIIPLSDDEYLISFNGARVVTAVSGTVMSEHLLPVAVVDAVAGYAREHEMAVQAYRGERFLVERDTPEARMYEQSAQMAFDVVPSLSAAVGSGTPKLLMIGDHDALVEHQRALSALAEELAGSSSGTGGGDTPRNAGARQDVASAPAFEVMFSKWNYLELVPAGVSKGTALRELCEKLSVPIGESIAAGDSINDIAMLRAAGLGIAVANARDEVKAAADVVLERTAEGGAIAELVERFFAESQ